MREYETFYILRADAPEDRVEKVQGKIEQVLEKSKGAVLGFDDRGSKRLAYEIQKSARGRMILVGYCAIPAAVAELERELRLDDQVIRFTTRRLDDNADPTTKKAEFEKRLADAVVAAKQAEENEREARENRDSRDRDRGDRDRGDRGDRYDGGDRYGR